MLAVILAIGLLAGWVMDGDRFDWRHGPQRGETVVVTLSLSVLAFCAAGHSLWMMRLIDALSEWVWR